MLLVSIGPDHSKPHILPQLTSLGTVVAILLPGHGLSRAEIRKLLADCYVIEFLSPPPGPTTIIAEAVAKLAHVLKGANEPLVLASRITSAAELSDILARIDENDIRTIPRRGGEPEVICFGAKIVENPLLPRFFTLLDEFGIVESRSMELLQQTFGGLRA